jgi:hypothetical protein
VRVHLPCFHLVPWEATSALDTSSAPSPTASLERVNPYKSQGHTPLRDYYFIFAVQHLLPQEWKEFL